MGIKKLKTEIIRVKTFYEFNTNNTTYLTCNGQIVFIYYNICYDNKDNFNGTKNILKYFCKNNKFIKNVSNLFKKTNTYYELYYKGNKFCGNIIIPNSFKQKPKDLLKEILLSKYNLKIISL